MPLTRKILVVVALALLATLSPGASMARGGSAARPRIHGFLWGAWIGKQFTGAQAPWSWAAVTDFEARNAGGRHLSAVHWGVGVPWVHQFRYWLTPLNIVQSEGAVSVVDMSTGSAPLSAVAKGAFDPALRTWASQAHSWGYPLYVRFDWEMNGSWFPWGTTANLNTPASFVAAWRHVHRIFTQAGATNVKWVWCPNIDPWHRTMTNVARLYPGKGYVDWTCLDGYNRNDPWLSFAQLFGRSYRQIMRLAPTKPMLLGEVGSTEHGGNKAQWIRSMFGAFAGGFSHIHGLLWWDQPGATSTGDYPIESSRSSSAAFSAGIGRTLARTCRRLSAPARSRCLSGAIS
jgi:hypothetical protein